MEASHSFNSTIKSIEEFIKKEYKPDIESNKLCTKKLNSIIHKIAESVRHIALNRIEIQQDVINEFRNKIISLKLRVRSLENQSIENADKNVFKEMKKKL